MPFANPGIGINDNEDGVNEFTTAVDCAVKPPLVIVIVHEPLSPAKILPSGEPKLQSVRLLEEELVPRAVEVRSMVVFPSIKWPKTCNCWEAIPFSEFTVKTKEVGFTSRELSALVRLKLAALAKSVP